MGRVEAWTKSVPAGMRATESAGTTTRSAYAPPWGPVGSTMAITSSPTAQLTPSPTSSTTPAASIPGTWGEGLVKPLPYRRHAARCPSD